MTPRAHDEGDLLSKNFTVPMKFSLTCYNCFLWEYPAAAAKSLQSCLTLCDPIDGSPPGSAVPAILQARTLEWVAISFSNAWKWKVKMKPLSRVLLLATPPWTAAYQAPLSMGFGLERETVYFQSILCDRKCLIIAFIAILMRYWLTPR